MCANNYFIIKRFHKVTSKNGSGVLASRCTCCSKLVIVVAKNILLCCANLFTHCIMHIVNIR